MTPADRPQFAAILARALRTTRTPMPDAEVLDVWWTKLAPFPLDAVANAFSRHLDESEHAPAPASILRRLPREKDGRPLADEAWAIALEARDESETVVWTDEIARAWHAVRDLVVSDEIGARLAFRAAYTRLVDDAEARSVPARWRVSLGHDHERRVEVVDAAVRAGRLSLADARVAVPALPAPDAADSAPSAETLRHRAQLRDLIGNIAAAHEMRAQEREDAAARATDATNERKREIAQQAERYAATHRAREPGDDDEPMQGEPQ
ncbi:hypothetical protein QFZ94_007492 [Paraburkholderia sp. JPY465]